MSLNSWFDKKPKCNLKCKTCNSPIVDIECNGNYYCMKCWHKYPEGFKTTGWEFVNVSNATVKENQT